MITDFYDGIYLNDSSDSVITNNTANSNRWGIYLQNSSLNTITNNTANSNDHGIYLGRGTYLSGNKLNWNTACDNKKYDFYVIGDFGSGDDNTCDKPYGWNDDETSGCTYPCIIGKSDLVITEIKCDWKNGTIGYVVKNIGNDVAPADHKTTLWVEGKEVCHDKVGVDLRHGASHQGWFKCYKWPECQTIRIKVCADNYDVVKESDEDNNCLEKRCECVPVKKPDLVIKDIKLTKMDGYCYVDYLISNTGTVSAATSTTYLYVDGKKVASDSTGALAPRASRWDRFTYRTTGAHTYDVCADGPNAISETNEANNCRTEELTCPLSLDIYSADGGESPGSVYHYNTTTGIEETVYTRPSRNLHSFTFHPHIPEKLYYVNANEHKIYRTLQTPSGWTPEEVLYTHTTYVRDIAFAFGKDGELRLYFSEATGAGGNGKIYKIEDGKASNTKLIYNKNRII